MHKNFIVNQSGTPPFILGKKSMWLTNNPPQHLQGQLINCECVILEYKLVFIRCESYNAIKVVSWMCNSCKSMPKGPLSPIAPSCLKRAKE